MGMTVKHNHLSQHEFVSAGWQILGELELPSGAEASGRSDAWLAEILTPLQLHADFLDKVLKSAQEAITRLSHPARVGVAFEHIRLLVFVPADSLSKGQNWGFFRIEKIASATTGGSFPNLLIEFFLYREEG